MASKDKRKRRTIAPDSDSGEDDEQFPRFAQRVPGMIHHDPYPYQPTVRFASYFGSDDEIVDLPRPGPYVRQESEHPSSIVYESSSNGSHLRVGDIDEYDPVDLELGSPECSEEELDALEQSSGGAEVLDKPGFRFRDGPRTVAIASRPVHDALPDNDDDKTDAADHEITSPGYSSSFTLPKRGSRRWFGTLNNPSLVEWQCINTFFQSKCEWGILGKEVGVGGTSHLQFAFRMKDAKTRSALLRYGVFTACYLSPCRGTEKHCKDYCSKEGDAMEFHPEAFSPGQGARHDLEQLARMVIKDGQAGIDQIIQENPEYFVRMHSGLQALAARCMKPRRLQAPPYVEWHMGLSNSGKTYSAFQNAEVQCKAMGSELYEMNLGNYPWMAGLREQKVALLNEFRATNSRGQQIPMDSFCKMWDVLGFNVEFKGSNVEMQCSHFYITCVQHPSEIYADKPQEPNVQFLRRITKVVRHTRVAGVDGAADTFLQEDLGCGTIPMPFAFMP